MLTVKTRIITAIFITLSCVSFASAQESTQPRPAPSASPAAESQYVEAKGFKGQIIEVKHRDPAMMVQAIGNLSSGFKGARISYNNEFNTVTVRDFPENIAAIEEAIKRLDTPQKARPDIEFRVHVLIASNTAAASDEYPAELGDVIKQLQSTLKYKSYSLMTSSVQRSKEGREGTRSTGVAESKLFNVTTPHGNPIFYSYSLQSISLDSAASGVSTVQIGTFNFDMRVPLNLGTSIQYENVGFRTPVSSRDGEKVVVGTTTMGDKGLVVVLLTRILK